MIGHEQIRYDDEDDGFSLQVVSYFQSFQTFPSACLIIIIMHICILICLCPSTLLLFRFMLGSLCLLF